MMSDKYKKNAHTLNLQSTYATIGAIVILLVIILLVLKFYIFWGEILPFFLSVI